MSTESEAAFTVNVEPQTFVPVKLVGKLCVLHFIQHISLKVKSFFFLVLLLLRSICEVQLCFVSCWRNGNLNTVNAF